MIPLVSPPLKSTGHSEKHKTIHDADGMPNLCRVVPVVRVVDDQQVRHGKWGTAMVWQAFVCVRVFANLETESQQG